MMRMGIKYLTAHSCSTEGSLTAQQQRTGHSEKLEKLQSNQSISCWWVISLEAHIILELLYLFKTQLCHTSITVSSSRVRKLKSL